MATDSHLPVLDRRRFLQHASRSAVGLALSGSVASLLAACARDDPTIEATAGASPSVPAGSEEGAIVGDVLDYALTSDDWEGDFGFVTLRLHRAAVDGEDAYLIRTDASDEDYASQQGLVFVPLLRALVDDELAGAAFVFDDANGDQPVVLSSEPGRDDYTPAREIHRVSWNGQVRTLRSAEEIERAGDAGELDVESTGIVVNAPLVVWPSGQLPVDDELTSYLGAGQLLEAPDLDRLQVRFKLHECYPGSRYIVTDTSAPPMAEGMQIGAASRLHAATDAGATGRVNVFMNGLEGPGPMGFQPSVFDSPAGDPAWSPYWDHLTYGWTDGTEPRVLEDEDAIHRARDDGDLDEFVGTPDTDGQGFVVNCPVPVVAPNTFRA